MPASDCAVGGQYLDFAFLVPDFTVKFGLLPKSHLIDVSMREVQAAQPEGKTTAFVHAIIVWGRA